jgi:hypothetical protein
MYSWSSKYAGRRPNLGIYTRWPQSISDSQNLWTKTFLGTVPSSLILAQDDALKRYVARSHDKNIDVDFDHYLYIENDICIDVSDFRPWLDLEHTTYIDANDMFVLYRRDKVWKDQIVDLAKKPKIGAIFIDCWQVLESHTWVISGFDYYHGMIQTLESFNLIDCVFHTNTYGDLSLSYALTDWRKTLNYRDVMSINGFKQHYHNINLRNWIVVGAHWQRCTHDRPLGFHNLLHLKKQDAFLKIYSLPNCVAKFVNNNIDCPIVDACDTADYQKDSLYWQWDGNMMELVN